MNDFYLNDKMDTLERGLKYVHEHLIIKSKIKAS